MVDEQAKVRESKAILKLGFFGNDKPSNHQACANPRNHAKRFTQKNDCEYRRNHGFHNEDNRRTRGRCVFLVARLQNRRDNRSKQGKVKNHNNKRPREVKHRRLQQETKRYRHQSAKKQLKQHKFHQARRLLRKRFLRSEFIEFNEVKGVTQAAEQSKKIAEVEVADKFCAVHREQIKSTENHERSNPDAERRHTLFQQRLKHRRENHITARNQARFRSRCKIQTNRLKHKARKIPTEKRKRRKEKRFRNRNR